MWICPANTAWLSPKLPWLLLPDGEAIQWAQTGRLKCQTPELSVVGTCAFQQLKRHASFPSELSGSSYFFLFSGVSTGHCNLTQGCFQLRTPLCVLTFHIGRQKIHGVRRVYPIIFGMTPTCRTAVWGSSTFQAWDGIDALGQDKEKSKSCLSDHLEIIFLICGTYGSVLNILCRDIKTKLFFKILPGVSSVSENNFWLMHANYMWNALNVNLAL